MLSMATKAGDKIRFTGEGGTENELFRARAAGLNPGGVYAAKRIHICSLITVELCSLPGHRFNVAMFDDAKEQANG